MEIFNLGLLIVIASWLIQLFYLFKGDKKIQPLFVGVYIVGVFLISMGTNWNTFQIISMLSSVLVFVKLKV